MILLFIVSFPFLLLLLRFMWKGKVAPPAVVCSCGRTTCVYHTLTQEELNIEMRSVARRLDKNTFDRTIIDDRLAAERYVDALMPMLAANITAFLEIDKDHECLLDCLRKRLGSISSKPT
jgi:hypothetical protein